MGGRWGRGRAETLATTREALESGIERVVGTGIDAATQVRLAAGIGVGGHTRRRMVGATYGGAGRGAGGEEGVVGEEGGAVGGEGGRSSGA